MPLPIAVSETAKSTLQNQVFEQIRLMIVKGQLKAGDPLPGTRELSMQMGISRNTALLAYERLISEGYIYTKPQVGTFVSEMLYEKVVSASANGDVETPAANGTVSDPPPPRDRVNFCKLTLCEIRIRIASRPISGSAGRIQRPFP